MKPKVLFVAENVTLAQVVRLVTLARALPPADFDVHFASSTFPEFVYAGMTFTQHQLDTLDAERATRALEAGKRLYERRTLQRYVEAELALMESIQPDVVVGDFRLSLSTSAEKFGIPCGVLINAYWSPFSMREEWPVPDHPIVRLVGEELARRYFPQAMSRVFDHFASPVNAVRKKYGLPPVGSLLQVLTHGDYTLYPDDPWLTPVRGAPPSHRFLGPVLWQPDVPMPDLAFADPARPLIYVTLGSSGKVDVLPAVLSGLEGLAVNAVVATAGRARPSAVPQNVRAVEYVPGAEMARRAAVVISNGGSTTGYQALAEGTPVVGIPTNLDQYLASQAICASGAGLEIKARVLTSERVREAVSRALVDDDLRNNAQDVARHFSKHDSGAAFRAWIEQVTQKMPARTVAAT